MTSSLVGSEMCIRDRTLREISLLKQDITQMKDQLASDMTMLESKIPDAVSYTHLTLPTICSV
eukprot:8459622-Prorocentrum_lima.AAC.1